MKKITLFLVSAFVAFATLSFASTTEATSLPENYSVEKKNWVIEPYETKEFILFSDNSDKYYSYDVFDISLVGNVSNDSIATDNILAFSITNLTLNQEICKGELSYGMGFGLLDPYSIPIQNFGFIKKYQYKNLSSSRITLNTRINIMYSHKLICEPEILY